MQTSNRVILAELQRVASEYARRAVTPYSGNRFAAAVLLSDGSVVPGVRVESASFSLTIPAVTNAITTAFALGRRDVVAVAGSSPVADRDVAYVSAFIEGAAIVEPALVAAGRPGRPASLPFPSGVLPPFVGDDGSAGTEDGSVGATGPIEIAASLLDRAFAPESNFRVACLGRTSAGFVPGVNVEHPEWTYILCAERNMIGTVVTYGLLPVSHVYLVATGDATPSPCGACRQLLAEFAGDAVVYAGAKSNGKGYGRTVPDLIPGAFTGAALERRDDR